MWVPGAAAGLMEGMNVAAWWHGLYARPEARESLLGLRRTGADWVAVVVTCYQRERDSTEILCLEESRTPTMDDLRTIIRWAKGLGFRVMLKPHLDVLDGTWRGLIDFGREEEKWRAWFDSYRKFILRYAALAAAEGVDLFCVGVELGGTMGRVREWGSVIREIRRTYPGPLTYAANWDGEMWKVPFWKDLDYVGIDAYYPLTGSFSPSLDELVRAWNGPLRGLGCLAKRVGNPILFTEIGYRSVDGALREPWRWDNPGKPDPQEQALGYRAFFEAVWGKESWFAGAFFWHWEVDPDAGGPGDTGYTPQGKPAEGVLREYFGG